MVQYISAGTTVAEAAAIAVPILASIGKSAYNALKAKKTVDQIQSDQQHKKRSEQSQTK